MQGEVKVMIVVPGPILMMPEWTFKDPLPEPVVVGYVTDATPMLAGGTIYCTLACWEKIAAVIDATIAADRPATC